MRTFLINCLITILVLYPAAFLLMFFVMLEDIKVWYKLGKIPKEHLRPFVLFVCTPINIFSAGFVIVAFVCGASKEALHHWHDTHPRKK